MLIEQAMIFALGFLVALLLVLLFLPAFWGRAIRLSIRKIGERLPMSMAEVAAERDGLRAESAIVQRRLEQARDRAMAERDGERGNVGRLQTKLASHEVELDVLRLDGTTRDRSLIDTRNALLAAEAELGTMHKDHYDAGAQLERAERQMEAARHEQHRLRDHADQRRMTIASLETRIEGMQATIDDLEASLREAEGAWRSDSIGMGSYASRPAQTERLLATLADDEPAAHGERTRIVEIEERLRQLELENGGLERDLAAARTAAAQEGTAGLAIDRDEIALVRKSISDIAAEVVRLGGLRVAGADAAARDTPPEAPNVLQIRRAIGREGHSKGPASDPLQQGHGKSFGAT